MTAKRSCRTCGWSGTYRTNAKADYAKRQHSCKKWLRKADVAKNAERIRQQRAQIDRTPKPCQHKQTTHQHGTHACYVLDRCKCIPCCKANSVYESDRNRRNAYGRSNYVDATPSREHVRSLMNQGMGLKRIVAVSDISQGLLWKLVYGKRKSDGTQTPSKRVRRDTEQRILAIELDLAGGAVVDGTEAITRLRALVALGWSMSKIADRLGIGGANFTPIIHGRRQLTIATVNAANALFDELSMTLPPNESHRDRIAFARARDYAAAAGWVPPLALDDLSDAVDAEAAELDDIAIDRRMAGDKSVSLTRAERVELLRRWAASDLPRAECDRRTGINFFRYLAVEDTNEKDAA